MNLSAFCYRGAGEGPRGPLGPFFRLSGLALGTRGSGGPLQHQHFSQVVAYPVQPQVIVVALQTQIATSFQPIAALQRADEPLHGLAHSGKAFITFLLSPAKRMTTPGPANDAAKHPPASQGRFPGSFGVGGIGKHRRLIAADHLLKLKFDSQIYKKLQYQIVISVELSFGTTFSGIGRTAGGMATPAAWSAFPATPGSAVLR
jgi:hypothetical protein